MSGGWFGTVMAAGIPLGVVLTIGLHGVALGFLWLLLTVLFWLILGECLCGPWGRRRQIWTIAVSSLLAAIIVVSVIGR